MAGVSTGDGNSFSLNLYPMLDVFSILICFLLMNFSASGQSAETSVPNLELPISATKMTMDEAATVSVTRNEIVIQGGISVPLNADGDVDEQYRVQGALKEAYEEFKKIRNSQETLKNRDQTLGLNKIDMNTLTMEADKTAKFKVIKRIMQAASQTDFISWKLAAAKSEI